MNTNETNTNSILIVDDNLQNIKVLGSTLKKNGYFVAAAKNGEAALKYLNVKIPDIILLDIMMDKMDGFEVCKNIKATPEISDIPIIFLTAKTAEEDIVKGFEAGAVDYITKPFVVSEVLVRVANHLRTKKYYDLSESQKQKLEKANKELLELNRFKEFMTYSIVHDLKNPLSLIANEIKNDAVKYAVYKMQNLVANLLNVQKFEEAKMVLTKEEISFDKIIAEVLIQTNYLIEEKNQKLIINAPKNLKLFVDSELITRVLINLLTNAAKFTPDNGSISISVIQNDTLIILDITDTGIGISHEFLPKVFDRFAQPDRQTNSNQYSTGLGLNFCKMTIEAHGGQITVASQINKGSTFTFTIPSLHKNQIPVSTTVINAQNYFLSPEYAAMVEPYLIKFASIKVYQVTQILGVINEITDKFTEPTIINWSKSLKDAVKSCNDDLYKELIRVHP